MEMDLLHALKSCHSKLNAKCISSREYQVLRHANDASLGLVDTSLAECGVDVKSHRDKSDARIK